MGKSVIIFALGPTHILCPFDDEVWAVNMAYARIHKMGGRLDKLFTSHKPGLYPTLAGTRFVVDHSVYIPRKMHWELIDQLIGFGLDVLSLHKIKGVRIRRYPLKRIIKKFGCDYFTCTMCYMIAYAIDKGYTKIRLYGVDMMTKDEFKYERGGVEYWIGYARGKGIEVEIPPDSLLCKNVTLENAAEMEKGFWARRKEAVKLTK